MHWLAAYALGIGTAALLRPAAMPLARSVRPVVRRAIKGGILVGREVRRVAEETSAAVGDLVAEAKDEIESAESSNGEPMSADGARENVTA
jgi:hypothetical protein